MRMKKQIVITIDTDEIQLPDYELNWCEIADEFGEKTVHELKQEFGIHDDEFDPDGYVSVAVSDEKLESAKRQICHHIVDGVISLLEDFKQSDLENGQSLTDATTEGLESAEVYIEPEDAAIECIDQIKFDVQIHDK